MIPPFRYLILLLLAVAGTTRVPAQLRLSDQNGPDKIPLLTAAQVPAIYTDPAEEWLVHKAAALLQTDIEKRTGHKPVIVHQADGSVRNLIIVGMTSRSALIRQLHATGKLPDKISGKWEAYQLQPVMNPVPGVSSALVIAGSDKRGTAYGVFEFSKQLGISPWYWWADVPVQKTSAIYVNRNGLLVDSPAVKYRGIFLNDEAPALSGWTKERFGGFNHHFYEQVFELLLRLKANYLWPAMWGNAFNDDDTLNPVRADQWGIVMGTSHHEPMLRAQQEWKRYGKGSWNYQTNDSVLRSFWQKGMENMGQHESIVTIGMRGDGDEPMTEGTATALLERIVADQRSIITNVTGKPAAATPQLWALYKEVQDYYDKGMRVPDDVTLLLCDDNWGNLRKLPKRNEKPRSGGYGIYYHFDYVGGPRNYKWINTNNIPRIWEQMNLAYVYGARQIWIVNVGDLKPMELPISFFLDQAWQPSRFHAGNLQVYTRQWAAQQFGHLHAAAIGSILDRYTQYNARRKPELLSPDTYPLDANGYDEAAAVVQAYHALRQEAATIGQALPAAYKDAYYQLVRHPVEASANLNELYATVARNRQAARRHRPEANRLAAKAKILFEKDAAITRYYNDTLSGGKWRHLMDQTHIGYTYWQQPPENSLPTLQYTDTTQTTVPVRDTTAGRQTPPGEQQPLVSIQAAHYTRAIATPPIRWQVIPRIGRDGDGITALPVTAPAQVVSAASPHLAYEVFTKDTGTIQLRCYFSPTLPFHTTGLQYAVSVDDAPPQRFNLHQDYNEQQWNRWVADNIILQTSRHQIARPGKHLIRYWLIDPAVVLQKLELSIGDLPHTYLGFPETKPELSKTRHR